MKQKRLFLAILTMAMLAQAANAQYDKSKLKNPDEATWAITGEMSSSIHGNNASYELQNPQGSHGKGGYIRFKRESQYIGRTVGGEQVVFSLQNAETDRPNKFRGEMIFWSWNDLAGEWQVDVESGSGRSEYESSANVNFMLVLDCSGSMGDGIRDVKSSAKFFLKRMLDVSEGKGNVRVGLIGFSTVEYSRTHTVDPLPLTQANYDYLCNYIDRFNSDGGTALWYSMNAAAEKLQNDYSENIKGKKFAGSAVVAFTDGHDNTSTDKAKGYSSSKDYYNKYFSVTYPHQKVNDMKIMTWIVGKRGDDITSDNIWGATVSQFRAMADEYIPISNMSELHDKFGYIAENLIERNTVLNLRVAEGISGRVGWTFPEEKVYVAPPKPVEPKKPVKMWLGVGLEGGMALMSYEKYSYSEYYGRYYLSEEGTESLPFGGLHVDAAWPLSTSFALGATASLTYCDGIGFAVGPLAKVTFKNNSALLASIGIRNIIDGIHPYLSVGWKFSSPWYISAFTTLNGGLWDFGVGVGYSILGGK